MSPPVPSADFGPRERQQRGEVVVLEVADPDAPNRTLRRAKATWAVDTLLSRGAICADLHAAACRFLRAYEGGVMGAKDRAAAVIARSSGPPTGPGDHQLALATDYREAIQAVGPSLAAPLVAIVLSARSISDYAADLGWHVNKTTGWVVAAMTRLADHYSAPRPR